MDYEQESYYGEGGESYYGEESGDYTCNTSRYVMDYDDMPQAVASYSQLGQISTGSPLWQTNRYLACGINDYIKGSDGSVIPEGQINSILTKIHDNLDKFRTRLETSDYYTTIDHERISFLNPKLLCIAIWLGGEITSANRDKVTKAIQSGEKLYDIIKYVEYVKKIKLF